MARIVLIADDSPTIQKKALGILKGEGFEVETVSNGVAAIKRLAVLRPCVILADVSMPGRDGYEVCEFVKKSAELSNVPVLLVASEMEPYDDARGAQVRADGIIKKPFEAHELIEIVMKFADKFAAMVAAAVAPIVVPSAPREPTQEFAFSSDVPDEMPTVMQPVAPDFSAASEGVAFAQPSEATPAFSSESTPAEIGGAYAAPPVEVETIPEQAPASEYDDMFSTPEPPSVAMEESPWVVEEPAAPSVDAPPPAAPPERPSPFLEGLDAATTEPVYIEDALAPAYEQPSSGAEAQTMIFRAPLEIAEPVWNDETIPEPPAPGSTAALEPQIESAAAPPLEAPTEQPAEPPHAAPSVAATSLDSFSLDDATAGQIHFTSHAGHSSPAEIASAEVGSAEASQAGLALEQIAQVEVAPAETSQAEPAPEEVAQAEVAPEETSPVESVPEEMAAIETAPSEPVSEEAPAAEPIPFGAEPEAPAPQVVSTDAAAETITTEAATSRGTPTGVAPLAPPTEKAPEIPLETPPSEPVAESAVPLPAYDWGLIYAVVHKTVVRMSPPALPLDAMEEMARRLADEIATEIANEASLPQA